MIIQLAISSLLGFGGGFLYNRYYDCLAQSYDKNPPFSPNYSPECCSGGNGNVSAMGTPGVSVMGISGVSISRQINPTSSTPDAFKPESNWVDGKSSEVQGIAPLDIPDTDECECKDKDEQKGISGTSQVVNNVNNMDSSGVCVKKISNGVTYYSCPPGVGDLYPENVDTRSPVISSALSTILSGVNNSTITPETKSTNQGTEPEPCTQEFVDLQASKFGMKSNEYVRALNYFRYCQGVKQKGGTPVSFEEYWSDRNIFKQS